MAEIHFEDKAAEILWKNIENDMDLLDDAEFVDVMAAGRDRRKVEVNLCTFLANSYFTEEDVQSHSHVHRREYFRSLDDINPQILKLRLSQEPLSVIIDLPQGRKQFSLGRAIGYSAIVPLKEASYKAYMHNDISAFEFTALDVSDAGIATYLFGEGLFTFTAFALPKVWRDTPGMRCALDETTGRPSRVTTSGLEPYSSIIRDLAGHVASYWPRLWLCDEKVVHEDRSLAHGTILFSDNGFFANFATSELGFGPPCDYPHNGKAGYPRYLLSLADFNEGKLDEHQSQKVRRTLLKYISGPANAHCSSSVEEIAL